MTSKKRLFIFGDSFSQTFKSHKESNSSWFLRYYNHINEVPIHFSEIISNTLDFELINLSVGGSSNYTIFDKFLLNYENINEDDFVIIGWTSINRFRIATQTNEFVDVLSFTSNPQQHDDVSLVTSHEIAINRDNHNIWWSEIDNFVKIISKLSKSKNIFHWTWESPKTEISYNIWSKNDIQNNIVMIAKNWKNIDIDVKTAVSNSCDKIFDLTKEISIDEVIDLYRNNKKIFFINREVAPLTTLGKICSKFNYRIYDTTNYKKECYRNFLPWFDYETIKQETNGVIDDLHYSRNGHKDFADMLIELLKQ